LSGSDGINAVPFSAAPSVALGEVDGFLEAEGEEELVVFVLDLDERRQIEHSAPDVGGHDRAGASDRLGADGLGVGQVLPFLVGDEAVAVADVEIEAGRNSGDTIPKSP
jgi:hypothetical protein